MITLLNLQLINLRKEQILFMYFVYTTFAQSIYYIDKKTHKIINSKCEEKITIIRRTFLFSFLHVSYEKCTVIYWLVKMQDIKFQSEPLIIHL